MSALDFGIEYKHSKYIKVETAIMNSTVEVSKNCNDIANYGIDKRITYHGTSILFIHCNAVQCIFKRISKHTCFYKR